MWTPAIATLDAKSEPNPNPNVFPYFLQWDTARFNPFVTSDVEVSFLSFCRLLI